MNPEHWQFIPCPRVRARAMLAQVPTPSNLHHDGGSMLKYRLTLEIDAWSRPNDGGVAIINRSDRGDQVGAIRDFGDVVKFEYIETTETVHNLTDEVV